MVGVGGGFCQMYSVVLAGVGGGKTEGVICECDYCSCSFLYSDAKKEQA